MITPLLMIGGVYLCCEGAGVNYAAVRVVPGSYTG